MCECVSMCVLGLALCACACQISMPDVLMIVAMATSFCSERKMSRMRAARKDRVKRGWTRELGGWNKNIFFMRQLL